MNTKPPPPILHLKIKTADGRVLQDTSFQSFPVLFGRSSDCHIVLPFNFISRTHATITVEKGQIFVRDLGSRHRLSDGSQTFDELRIRQEGTFYVGELSFEVSLETPESGSQVTAVARTETALAELAISLAEPEFAYRNLFKGKLKDFDYELDGELQALQKSPVALQAAISWGEHLFDIRNFLPGDKLVVNSRLYQEISLPALTKKVNLGKYAAEGAKFEIPASIPWDITREGVPLTGPHLTAEKRLTQKSNRAHFSLKKNEVLTVHFSPILKAHFRYIVKPRPDFPRTWIENKEQFKKAAQISFGVHIVVALICLLSAPKNKAPTVENVPPRFARLLVEPPKLVPPPPPIPEPTPTPPPVVEQKPPEPVPVPKVELPKPKPKPPQKVAKAKSNPLPPKAVPQAAQKEEPAAAEGPVSEKPVQPEPSAAEREASALADMLNSAPSVGAQGLPSDIKVTKSGGSAAAGIKVGGMAGAVPSNGQPVASGLGKTPSALAGAGQGGLAQTTGNKAGKRAVKAVVAEPPVLKNTEQGLSQDELNAVIAKYVSQVQRCYERALFDNPQLVGRIEYEWTIEAAGQVSESHVKRSEIAAADGLNQCVLKVISSMKFPVAKNNLSTIASVGFPFGKQ